ncbi:MAG: ankyrin repeat domain-containing protein [Acidobacteriota bacterium]|nr:ankyrin repeat domain-containing protein [Acidobacteriota bacterium]
MIRAARMCAPPSNHGPTRRLGNWFIGVTMTYTMAATSLTAADDRRLVEAVKHHEMPTIQALLAEGVDVNVPEIDGTTALHWAVHHDATNLVDRLLRAGARVSAPNRYGIEPLSIASLNANVVIVESLLEAGADPKTSQPEGETVLMTAARTGNIEVVRLLVDRGADVDTRETFRGQTATMWAAAEGHTDVVRLLVRHGADIYTRSTFPARIDIRRMSRRAIRAERPEGLTPILFAVRGGHIETVLALLDAGAGVNDTAPSGYSLLHLAIMNAHFELGATLLEQGADPNATGPLPGALTPLHHLIEVRRPEWTLRPDPLPTGRLDSLQLMKALLAHGAQVNAPLPPPPENRRVGADADEQIPPPGGGATPLWLAARGPDPEAMRLLIAAGADPMVETDDGATLLMSAAGIDYRQGPREKLEPQVLEAVTLALDLGANVTAADINGNTALHGAAIRGANSTVRLLLERGARIDAKNDRGRMALDIAEDASDARSQPETARLLRELMKARDGAQ